MITMPDSNHDNHETFPSLSVCDNHLMYFENILEFREEVAHDFPLQFSLPLALKDSFLYFFE
jgi:hypothetical protein